MGVDWVSLTAAEPDGSGYPLNRSVRVSLATSGSRSEPSTPGSCTPDRSTAAIR